MKRIPRAVQPFVRMRRVPVSNIERGGRGPTVARRFKDRRLFDDLRARNV
jgi:hypothetical protein